MCILRGGGDLATGVAWRLSTAGFRVVVLELAKPLTVRRTVALSTAVADGVVEVEGMIGRRFSTFADAADAACDEAVGVVVSPGLPADHGALAVVDARLAKRNVDTHIGDAPVVVALGPGFEAGVDCHAVVETNRGHRLGRVLWQGRAEANTGVPGIVGGRGVERVLRAPVDGVTTWWVQIGDVVESGHLIGSVGGVELSAPFDGVIRGLICEGTAVRKGLKIADVDPRVDTDCCTISDKALAIGGGVVEAVLSADRRVSR
ncbi:MAG: EF2563 family selenium-dependent molybdenum hydroxylase system protein [Actinomycetia bacterium]|nr:EF2563 family selenium-dependent molybdenum hydroxylase system protein [Actinomycetes bacterium]MCP4961786.1 EF2563 family selenium-dependent molybdenum hydroxylase system protein [Actinomycetes bacterium]